MSLTRLLELGRFVCVAGLLMAAARPAYAQQGTTTGKNNPNVGTEKPTCLDRNA